MKVALSPSPEVCVKCKGRLWCGPNCYILEKYSSFERSVSKFEGNSLAGSSPPGFFVSHTGYPKVAVAPMSPAEHLGNASILDDTDKWFGLPEKQIISYRQSLVRGTSTFDATSAARPSYELSGLQELVMSTNAVDVEIELKRRPLPSLSFSDAVAPMGPSAELKNFSLAENPKVNQKVERIVSDTDAKALTGMQELFSGGVGVNQLHKLLSAGLLGVEKRRRLVPTRWAITAIDSNLSQYLLDERIKHFSTIDEAMVFESHYLDNHFYILLIPRIWSFEVLEAWKPGGIWTEGASEPHLTSDFEFYGGRKTYAENVTGAYYAARLALCEYLMLRRRQCSAVVFREIGSDYKIPLGVWQIRENVRNALKARPISFSGLGLAFSYLSSRLSVPIDFWKKKSAVLSEVRSQKRLADFA